MGFEAGFKAGFEAGFEAEFEAEIEEVERGALAVVWLSIVLFERRPFAVVV